MFLTNLGENYFFNNQLAINGSAAFSGSVSVMPRLFVDYNVAILFTCSA